MTKRYSVSLDNETAEAFDKFVGDGFASEKLRDIVKAFLKDKGITDIEEPRPTPSMQRFHSQVKNIDFLYDMFTCPLTRDTMQVGALPCVQTILTGNPKFECRNHVCLGTLKRTLGIGN